MLKLDDMSKKELSVVNDQIVSVTYTKDLDKLIINMVETNKYSIYHAANGWYFLGVILLRKYLKKLIKI